jgi:hypothetical protein
MTGVLLFLISNILEHGLTKSSNCMAQRFAKFIFSPTGLLVNSRMLVKPP